MSHPNDTKHDPLKPAAVTNKPADQQAPEAQKGTTSGRDNERKDTDKGPGIGQTTPRAEGTQPEREEDVDQNLDVPDNRDDNGTMDERGDQHADPNTDVKGHKVGDAPPEHTTRAND